MSGHELKDRKQVESLVAKIAEEDEKEAKARAEKQKERLVSPSQVAMSRKFPKIF